MTITTNHTAETRHDAVVTNDTDPDPEGPERARGPRRFPASYKSRILAAATKQLRKVSGFLHLPALKTALEAHVRRAETPVDYNKEHAA